MENLWIMAQAGPSSQGEAVAGETQSQLGQSEVSAEPAGQEGQAMTAVDSNAVAANKGTTRSTPGIIN